MAWVIVDTDGDFAVGPLEHGAAAGYKGTPTNEDVTEFSDEEMQAVLQDQGNLDRFLKGSWMLVFRSEEEGGFLAFAKKAGLIKPTPRPGAQAPSDEWSEFEQEIG